MRPRSCNMEATPSAIFMWAKPISRRYSSLSASGISWAAILEVKKGYECKCMYICQRKKFMYSEWVVKGCKVRFSYAASPCPKLTFHYLEEGADDIIAGISSSIKSLHPGDGRTGLASNAVIDDASHGSWMRLITNLEDVLLVDVAETTVGSLKVVKGISHVTLGREDDGLQPTIGVAHLLGSADEFEPGQDLLIREAAVPKDCGAGLDGLDDLGGDVARQGETGGVGVDLHGPAEGLLGRRRHAVGLVKDDDLVAAGRKTDLVLSESLDLVPHHINTSGVGCIEFQDTVGVGLTKQLAGKSMDACGLLRQLACIRTTRKEIMV